MEFGKLLNITNVNFKLPDEPSGNSWVLENLPQKNEEFKIYLGATGYNMREWLGKWSPEKTKIPDFLRQYGIQFNNIEHNTTHYRIPDIDTIKRWYEDTPPDFRYCPKIPQTLSHARDLGISNSDFDLFCRQIAQLKEKNGCTFLQVPPHFSTAYLPVLQLFLKKWPRELPLAVEVRHESFFQKNHLAEAYFDLLQKENIASVITDVAGRRDVCHLRLTNERVLVRFVGNNLHDSDFSRIQDWAERLETWAKKGLHEVYFFTHEPDNLLAPDLAVFAGEVFSKKMPSAKLRFPKVIKAAAVQGSLF